MTTEPIHLHPLTPDHAAEAHEFWQAAHPLHPLDFTTFKERLLGPPDPDPDLLVGARDPLGRLVGLGAGVYPCRKEPIGGIRWIGALPGLEHERILILLLEALIPRLAARGAAELHLMATPPHYIRPGIDIRETGLIAFFLSRGWQHAATHFNMTCNLSEWQTPGEGSIFGPDAAGYNVRRADPADREPLADFVEQHWTPGWRAASALAFLHNPISVFIAEKDNRLVGFAAYEVDQCAGTFGPTGVAGTHRGHGLGQRLLHACLRDLKSRGLREAAIGWVGPVPFYHRACNASLGPAYWLLTKKLSET